MSNIKKGLKYIWYNPDLMLYQKGTMEEFERLVDSSPLHSNFSLIVKLNTTSDLLAHKIIEELNDVLLNNQGGVQMTTENVPFI